MNIREINENLEKLLEDWGVDDSPYIVQVDSEIEDMEPMEIINCDSLEKASEVYKEFQTQFKDVENARWITLSKLGDSGYEQQKLYDLKDGVEI